MWKNSNTVRTNKGNEARRSSDCNFNNEEELGKYCFLQNGRRSLQNIENNEGKQKILLILYIIFVVAQERSCGKRRETL